MKPASPDFDTTGFTLWRTLRLSIMHRMLPPRTADFRGGPGWRCLARMAFWRVCGRMIFALNYYLENRSRAWRALTRGRL